VPGAVPDGAPTLRYRPVRASARPVAPQGSISPRIAAASMTSAPAASGASDATARIVVRRTDPLMPATAGHAPARSITGPVITR
jgi:hypothetical protein